MADIQVQLRRGTTTQHGSFTGAEGEVTVDTDLDTLRVHDGSTAGGIRLAKHSELSGAGAGGTVTEVDAGTGLETSPASGITTTGTIGIANGGVGTNQLASDAVTSAKISSTDTQFLVDNTSPQKKVVINDSNDDVDFTVKGGGSTILVDANAGDYLVNLAPSMIQGALAVFNSAGGPTATEGGQINFNKSTESQGTFSESDSFSIDAFKDSLNSHRHGTNAQMLRVIQTTGGAVTAFAENGDISFDGALFPILTGTKDLGTSALKWRDVYSTTGAFNGSDANLKQDIEELSEAERRVAVAAKGLLKKYRLKQAVEEKGEQARYHFGIVAQELQAAFQAEGLDPMKYGIIAVNTWYEKTEGDEKYVSKTMEEGYEQVTEMSVRYSELLAFIIAAL